MQNPQLYDALLTFPLGAVGGEVTFKTRLGRENAWTRAQCERAIAEYKKLLYLATVSATPVLPSTEVEKVWNLHLRYTHSYWEQLPRILGRPLHHTPGGGGRETELRDQLRYRRTKALYAVEFGARPPVEFWPEELTQWDTVRHIVVPRLPRRAGPRLAGMVGLILVLASFLIHQGPAAWEFWTSDRMFGFSILLLVIAMVGIYILVRWVDESAAPPRRRKRQPEVWPTSWTGFSGE